MRIIKKIPNNQHVLYDTIQNKICSAPLKQLPNSNWEGVMCGDQFESPTYECVAHPNYPHNKNHKVQSTGTYKVELDSNGNVVNKTLLDGGQLYVDENGNYIPCII